MQARTCRWCWRTGARTAARRAVGAWRMCWATCSAPAVRDSLTRSKRTPLRRKALVLVLVMLLYGFCINRGIGMTEEARLGTMKSSKMLRAHAGMLQWGGCQGMMGGAWRSDGVGWLCAPAGHGDQGAGPHGYLPAGALPVRALNPKCEPTDLPAAPVLFGPFT